MSDTPKNAGVLVKLADANGWIAEITEGEGVLERGRGETKRTEPARSVAVRLRRGGVRAFGVWVRSMSDDGSSGQWKFSDGAAIRPVSRQLAPRGGHIFALLGYRDLVGMVERAEV